MRLYLEIGEKSSNFALANRRDGRVVDRGGLENR